MLYVMEDYSLYSMYFCMMPLWIEQTTDTELRK
jgi:hypothetical protein